MNIKVFESARELIKKNYDPSKKFDDLSGLLSYIRFLESKIANILYRANCQCLYEKEKHINHHIETACFANVNFTGLNFIEYFLFNNLMNEEDVLFYLEQNKILLNPIEGLSPFFKESCKISFLLPHSNHVYISLCILRYIQEDPVAVILFNNLIKMGFSFQMAWATTSYKHKFLCSSHGFLPQGSLSNGIFVLLNDILTKKILKPQYYLLEHEQIKKLYDTTEQKIFDNRAITTLQEFKQKF